MERETLRSALRASQVTYDRTGSIERAHRAAVETCYAAGCNLRESQSVAQWTLRKIRTHHFQD